MALVIRKAVIVYLSPAGTTRHVAGLLHGRLKALDTPVTEIDLGGEPDIPFIMSQLPAARENICLYVGSPVYASHPVPPVMEFISRLPGTEAGCAVPFVTWGGVSSGIALYRMGKALVDKGYRILGAAKVMSEHSLTWSSREPMGKGHPDANDDRLVESLLDQIHRKLRDEDPQGISIASLARHPAQETARMERMTPEAAKARLPAKHLVRDRCTACGRCVEVCPVEAVTLAPYPAFSDSCIACFNCVRHCPEKAIEADLSAVCARVRARALEVNERPPTEIIV